jgi:hypothetical protein
MASRTHCLLTFNSLAISLSEGILSPGFNEPFSMLPLIWPIISSDMLLGLIGFSSNPIDCLSDSIKALIVFTIYQIVPIQGNCLLYLLSQHEFFSLIQKEIIDPQYQIPK